MPHISVIVATILESSFSNIIESIVKHYSLFLRVGAYFPVVGSRTVTYATHATYTTYATDASHEPSAGNCLTLPDTTTVCCFN